MTVKTASSQPNISPSKKKITGEELFAMGDIGRTELVKGEIVYMSPTGYFHGLYEGNFYRAIDKFVHSNKLGHVLVGEVGIYTNRNPDTIRAADVAFISKARLAQVQSQSYLDVAPELIVEILSPDDRWGEVMEKLEEYFAIDVQMVWIADPQRQQVHVYRSMTDVERLKAEDELSGGEVLPGFGITVAELFETE